MELSERLEGVSVVGLPLPARSWSGISGKPPGDFVVCTLEAGSAAGAEVEAKRRPNTPRLLSSIG